MHTISTMFDGSEWQVHCRCGWYASGFHSESAAQQQGNGHRQREDGRPNNADNYRDDPRVGY